MTAVSGRMKSNHVHILTMGGTIDKDYPRLTSGYAFEFGDESAASRILKNHPNLGVSYDVSSICAKDSLEVGEDDRQLLWDAIMLCVLNNGSDDEDSIVKGHVGNSSERKRIVVTHGTDTMVESGALVRYFLLLLCAVYLFVVFFVEFGFNFELDSSVRVALRGVGVDI